MEPKVGQVSGVLEEREQGIPRGSKRWAGRDYGWQTQESFEKVLSMRNGGAFFDFTRQFIGDPVEQTLGRMQQALTKTGVYQNILKPIIEPAAQVAAENIPPIIQSSAVGQTLEDAEIVTEVVREELRQRGQDPRFADTGRMLAEEAVGGVLGKTVGMAGKIASKLPPTSGGMALATAAVSAAPMPPMSVAPSFERGGLVMKATTSPEFTGPGMGQGVAKSPKYAGTVESYMESVPTFSDAAAEIERRFAAGEITASRRKNALSKLKKKADAELSTFAYDPENPPVYAESSRTKATREAQIPDPIAELITEKPAKAHQHHYLAKAQTRPFVDKMLELVNNNVADLDDLVNFFTWPEQYQLYPGNVRSNMADLSPRAHVPSEAVTEFDRKFNVHRMLQDVGLEVKSGTKGGATEFITKNYGLQNVKTADDLMRAWDQFLQEIGIPGKESAKTIQEFFLTEYRKGLSGDKLKQFNEMAAKLYK